LNRRVQVEGVDVVAVGEGGVVVLDLDQLAVGQQARVQRGPVGVHHLLVQHAGTAVSEEYSATQSS
jgi:hypothetical protein